MHNLLLNPILHTNSRKPPKCPQSSANPLPSDEAKSNVHRPVSGNPWTLSLDAHHVQTSIGTQSSNTTRNTRCTPMIHRSRHGSTTHNAPSGPTALTTHLIASSLAVTSELLGTPGSRSLVQ
ncbi:hypothetical protein CC80DRAFT_491492 [Byssothecium circinans]|uniref:Uncharacterized protein n=1 Tax=Byssothecium circinans TaxID=147558 RepID=A0A6A5U307_9PLEO|nr:hypothetical protein CC80DRAFT_491492 [Byssothecium circinans]